MENCTPRSAPETLESTAIKLGFRNGFYPWYTRVASSCTTRVAHHKDVTAVKAKMAPLIKISGEGVELRQGTIKRN